MTVARRDFSGQGDNCMLATQNESRCCALPTRGEAEVYLTTSCGELENLFFYYMICLFGRGFVTSSGAGDLSQIIQMSWLANHLLRCYSHLFPKQQVIRT
jgi:hypothetical protein